MPSQETPRFGIGRAVISAVALMTAISPFLADWNETHIYNPFWPPHAKFHNGQTMLMGAALGLLSLYALWLRGGDRQHNLFWGAVLAALYWATQSGAILFPGAGFTDPQLGTKLIMLPGGVPFNQVMLDAIILPTLLLAYLRERALLTRAPA